MIDWDEATAQLEKKLDPANIKPARSQGPKGDYIEGWHAIAEANRIFGYGNWSYTITGLTKDSCEQVEKQGRDGPYKQWQAAYTCIVRVTVGDTVREDVGFGSGFAGNIGDAIEGATKEAVTDALKRCLRTFGNPFGLALYDKGRSNVGRDVPQEVLDAAMGAETLESLQTVWTANREWQSNPEFEAAKETRKLELMKDAA